MVVRSRTPFTQAHFHSHIHATAYRHAKEAAEIDEETRKQVSNTRASHTRMRFATHQTSKPTKYRGATVQTHGAHGAHGTGLVGVMVQSHGAMARGPSVP